MIFQNPTHFINSIRSHHSEFGLIAFDFGDRKIGVAITYSIVQVVTPLTVIERTKMVNDIAKLKLLINQYKINGIIVGLPLSMDGQETEQGKKIRKLVEVLAKEINTPIIFEDERMTTKLANTLLEQGEISRKKRAVIDDKISAQIILESFLKRI